jgi:hypothetical protein
MASKNNGNLSFNSILLENSSTREVSSLSSFSNQSQQTKVTVLKFSSDDPQYGSTKIPIPTYERSSQQSFLKETAFKIGLKTTIYLNSPHKKTKLNRSNISDKALNVICQFSSYLSADSQLANSLEVFGRSINGVFGLRNNSTLTSTALSFTQPAPQMPKKLLAKCRKIYDEQFKEKHAELFLGLAINIAAKFTKQRCEINSDNSNDNDEQCLDWLQKREHLSSQNIKAQCSSILSAPSGTGFCVAAALQEQPCPIFLDKYFRLTDNPDGVILSLKTSLLRSQFFCSNNLDLHCKSKTKKYAKVMQGVCRP